MTIIIRSVPKKLPKGRNESRHLSPADWAKIAKLYGGRPLKGLPHPIPRPPKKKP